MELRNDYLYKGPYNLLTDFTTRNNLVQLVNFATWTRTINGVRKESTFDHVYTDNDTLVNEVTFKVPTFGAHKLVIAKLSLTTNKGSVSICKRDWRNYSPNIIIDKIKLKPQLRGDVQSMWNSLEHSLIVAADIVAPITKVNHPAVVAWR